MNRNLLVCFVLGFTGMSNLKSQGSNDTALYPYWIEMMKAPDANYYKVKRAFDLYWKDSIPERGHGYKVFKRWEWRVRDKMLADGTIVWNKGALNESGYGGTSASQDLEGFSTPCPAQGRWTAVGPYKHPYNQSGQPTGIGRINGLAFHPKDSNTVFALAPQGGVWKTTDNGLTWAHIFGNNPVVNTIGVSTMVISYNNSDTMYIGTGDRDGGDAPGMGVLWTTDGGKTWAARNSGISTLTVAKIVMHPKNSAILLVATNGGIYRSTNSGLTWTFIVTGNFTDLVLHPWNPDIVYATRNGLFFRSSNNGVSFTQITTGLPSSSSRGQIAVSKANRSYVYFVTTPGANFQGLYRSADSGLTFSTRSTTPNIMGYYDGTTGTSDLSNGQGWYDIDIDADPKNAEIVYVGGINIWRSNNGGTSWTQVAHWYGGFGADDIHADQHAIEFNNTGNKLYSGNDGGVYYTVNAGSRWINISTGIQNSQIYRIAHAKTDEFVGAHGYQDNGSSQTTRDEFYTYYGGDGMDCQVDPTDANYVYGSYVYGRIYRAIDKTSIRTVGNNGTGGINENGAWLTPFILQEGQPGTMFAGYSNVWRTTAVKTGNPPTWTSISTGFGGIRMLENSPARNSMLFALQNNGSIQRTGNANSTPVAWSNLGTGPGGVRWIEAHHRDSNRVYCVNSTTLYRSANKGATWTAISTPSGAGALKLCYIDTSSKTELIYIGTERGIYVWDSLGNQTINYNNSFPVWADVTDIDIWYSPRGREQSKVVVSTYGRGVWRSNLYNPGTQKPRSQFYVFDSVLTVGGKLRFYEKVSGSASSLVWKITPYNFTYTDGTDSTSYAPSVQFNKKGLYTIRLIATNCYGSDTFRKSSWLKVFDKPVNPFCRNTTTFSTSNSAIGLFRFSLSDNSNETGGYFDDGQNIDFTGSKVFRLRPNTSYTITAKSGPYNAEFLRMFIDYNGDGRFQNFRNEVTASTAAVLGTKTLTFTTPAAPTKRNVGLRFRLLSDFSAIDTNACRNLSNGQGEDYSFVFDLPVPYFTASKLSACVGETITFTDTSEGLADRWDWDFGAGASPRTAQGQGPHQVTYSTAGSKSVRLRINGSDSVRKNAYINIGSGPDPVLVLKSGVNTGCEGRSITLAVRNRNGVAVTYQWQKNGLDMSGKTDSLLTLNNLVLSDSGNYTGVLINGACRASSSIIKIVVYPKPAVSYSVNSGNQCLKANQFVFTNNSSIAQGNMTYNWTLGDGGTSTSTNVTKTYSTAGTYNIKLVASSNRGCRDSASSTVTVFPRANIRFTVNDSDQCFSGNNFVFTNNSSLTGGTLSYNWQFGDGGSSTATSPTKSYTASGSYSVLLIGTTDKGCTDTASKPLRVYATPKADYQLSSVNPQCLRGNRFAFSNKSISIDGSMTYRWTFGDGSSSTTNSPAISYLAIGDYPVKLVSTSSFGCRDSITQTMSVKANPRSFFTVNDSDQCLTGNNFTFENLSSISVGSIASRVWSYGDGTNSTLPAPNKSYSSRGSYTITLISVSDWGCRDTFRKNARIYGNSNISFLVNNSDQCLKGNRFVFTNNSTATDGTLGYRWDFGNGNSSTATTPSYSYATAGNYLVKLVGTTTFGCKDSSTANLNVWPQGKPAFKANDSDQCLRNNSFAFANSSTISSGVLAYFWNFGDGTTTTLTSPTKSYSAFGTRQVTLISTSDKGCLDTVKKSVRVYVMPVAGFAVNPNNACLRGNVFTSTNNGSIPEGSFTTTWKNGNGSSFNGNNNNYSYSSAATYTIWQILSSNFGCADSISRQVVVHPMPKAAFTVSPADLCEGELTYSSNQSSISAGTMQYVWSFGNGFTKNGDTASGSYSKHGSYQIVLVANSDKGCKDTARYTMKVASVPVAAFVALPNPACAEQSVVTFSNNSSNADGKSISSQWLFGDAGSSAVANPVHTYMTAGIYKPLLTVNNGKCKDTAQGVVTIVPAVSAAFTTEAINKETRAFYAVDTTLPGYQYLWSYGDGKQGSGLKTRHMYGENGSFVAKLYVENSLGCKDSSTQTIDIISPNYTDQNNAASFYVYPNPNSGVFTYKFKITQKQTVEVKLFNIIGQTELYTATWENAEPGNYFQSVDLKKLQLSKGTYPLIVYANGEQYVVKVIYVGD